MVRAKLPVKHMPTAPTPGPPRSVCAKRATAQPCHDGTGATTGERSELGADARASNNGLACPGERIGAVDAEKGGKVHGEAGISHPTREPRDVGADTRHLGHEDDRRPCPGDVHGLVDAIDADGSP
ncbi:hypothetical protein ACR6C2_44915 [Streptomyces sp. INA 01156]